MEEGLGLTLDQKVRANSFKQDLEYGAKCHMQDLENGVKGHKMDQGDETLGLKLSTDLFRQGQGSDPRQGQGSGPRQGKGLGLRQDLRWGWMVVMGQITGKETTPINWAGSRNSPSPLTSWSGPVYCHGCSNWGALSPMVTPAGCG